MCSDLGHMYAHGGVRLRFRAGIQGVASQPAHGWKLDWLGAISPCPRVVAVMPAGDRLSPAVLCPASSIDRSCMPLQERTLATFGRPAVQAPKTSTIALLSFAIAAKKRKELGRGGAATTQSRNHRRKPGPRLEVHAPHMPAMSPCCGSAHCSNPRRSQFQRSMPAGLRASSCLCLPVATGRRRGLGHQRRMPEPRATS
jgi:hypothetical protein